MADPETKTEPSVVTTAQATTEPAKASEGAAEASSATPVVPVANASGVASGSTGATAPPAAAAAPEVDKAAAVKAQAQAAKKAFGNAAKGIGNSVKNFIFGLLTFPFFIFRGNFGLRLLGLAFIVSLVFLAWGTFGVYKRFVVPKMSGAAAKSDTGKELGEFLKNQKELTIAAQNVVFLERFSAQLVPSRSRARLFEVEIAVELDDPQTSRFIKANLVRVQEAVSVALQNKTYEDLLKEEGKENLKKEIIKSINRVIEKADFHGEAVRVFFTRFVMASS